MWRTVGYILLILVGLFLVGVGFLFIAFGLSSYVSVRDPSDEFFDFRRALAPRYLSVGLIAFVGGGVCLLIGAWWRRRVARPKEVRDDSDGEGGRRLIR
jgi:hypothetical protein